MRLIDADKLIEDIYSNAYACTNDEINKILHKQLETNINVINNQSTAFDVDKIVEKLEELRVNAFNDEVLIINDAIEIVERGGRDE